MKAGDLPHTRNMQFMQVGIKSTDQTWTWAGAVEIEARLSMNTACIKPLIKLIYLLLFGKHPMFLGVIPDSGITSNGSQDGMLGLEPGLAICKANALPAILSLQSL